MNNYPFHSKKMLEDTAEIIIPQNWKIDKIEDNKIILKERKKEFPKTWEECFCKCKKNTEFISNGSKIIPMTQLDINRSSSDTDKNSLPKGLGSPMLALMQLLICREIYRDGWKPNIESDNIKYCIINIRNRIKIQQVRTLNQILSFQDKETAEKFLKNFKNLIETAKELI